MPVWNRVLAAAVAVAGVIFVGCATEPSNDPQPTPILGLSPTSVSFSAQEGGTNPAPTVVTVSNTGGGNLGTVSASISYGGSTSGWLTTAVTPTSVTLTATTGAVPAGTHTATVSVGASAAENTPQTISVTFTVTAVPTFTVGGSVSGLTGTVVLQNNGGDNLTLSASGGFTFATALADASPYAVTVLTQPSGQTCTVANGSGTLSGANVTNVQVTCSSNLFTVGGNVSGLTGTVVLQNNGGDDLTLTANGGFTFATALADGSPYAVTVLTQPSGQTCSVANGSGTLSGSAVTNVQVTCATNLFTVGGSVSGLTGTVVLQNNGGDDLTLSANGSFTFATALADGSPYAVTVLTQPGGQTCSVANGSGTLSGANVTNVQVTCATNLFTVGGSVSGLTGTVVLQNNGGDDLTLSANAGFTFATSLADGSPYAVTVLTQPGGQTCSVANGSGTLSGANVTNVQVTCATNLFTVGGSVSGLTGTVVLQNNGGDDLTLTASGGFTFATALADGSPYAVTVLTQPSGQTCSVANGSGTLSGANVTNVQVTCATNLFTVGGSVSGLTGTVVLQNNGGDDLTLSANAGFTFATSLADGSPYAVTVLTQPSGQTCSVANGSGTLSGADVTNVQVTCATNLFTVGGSVSGLTGTVVLQNNGGDDLTLSANAGFTFATSLADGSPYAVTVLTQPSGQTCSVTNGSGTISSANVTNVQVTCSNILHTLTVQGAGSGDGNVSTARNTLIDCDIVAGVTGGPSCSHDYAEGTYKINLVATATPGSAFAGWGGDCVVVAGECEVSPTGPLTVLATFNLSTNFTIGGSVTGLSGTVVLQNNGGDNLTLSANGGFTFATALADGSPYAVTVLTQPSGQTCSVANGSGTISGGNVTNVQVTCSNILHTLTVQGAGSGSGNVSTVRNTLIDCDIVAGVTGGPSCTHDYAEGTYKINLAASPSPGSAFAGWGGDCVVVAGECEVSPTKPLTVLATFNLNPIFTIGGNVTGLSGTVVLQNNGSDNLTLSANGSFIFATALADGAPYAVTVLTQPSGQTCSVTNGSGTISGGNVTNVQVTCAATLVNIAIVQGNDQTAPLTGPLPINPTVRVTDQGTGNPVAGVTVNFFPRTGEGTVNTFSVITDSNGDAAVQWTLGRTGSNFMDVTAGSASTQFFGVGSNSAYKLEVIFLTPATVAQKTAFGDAAGRWMDIITGDLGDINFGSGVGPNACGVGDPNITGVQDDLIVFASLVFIDGPGGILGMAGPCFIRTTTDAPLSVVGVMQFDTADLPSMEAAGTLGDVILHEMAHTIGVGTLWNQPPLSLRNNPSLPSSPGADTHFSGANAVTAFNALPGGPWVPPTSATSVVPVENTQGGQGTRDAHWRESTFVTELMTGFIAAAGNPLSTVTIQSLLDMGYTVNISQADAYTLGNPNGLRAGGTSTVFHLKDDILRIPIKRIDQNGRVVGVVAP